MKIGRMVGIRLAWMGLTQKDLAGVLGVDPSSLSRTLRAERPQAESVRKIALALGLDVDDLMVQQGRALLKPHPASPSGQPTLDELRSWLARQDSP